MRISPIRFRDLWIVAVLSACFLVTACGIGGGGEGGSGSTDSSLIVPVTSDPDPLSGTRWELVAFEGEEGALRIPPEAQLFVEFDQGSLKFTTGCNDPSGYYTLEGEQITITFAKITTMDCTNKVGEEVMAIENAFGAVLPTFESYTIDGDELRIRHASGELVFRR